MLYDLNIAWSPGTRAAELERTLRFSAELGYDVVALNHAVDAPLAANLTNPLPRFPPAPAPPLPTPSSSSAPPPRPRLPAVVLHRITVSFSDPAQNPQLARAAQAYDLVALRPRSERAFHAVCLGAGAPDAALISLDLAARLPFRLRPKPCMAAVARGLRFEVAYAPALAASTSADAARARACFAGNLAQLVRATRGRGLLLASEAAAPAALRAPADLVNLLAVWGGLPPDRGAAALGPVPRAVVANEALRRAGFRGVVGIVDVAAPPGGDARRPAAEAGEADADPEAARKGRKKKRKNSSDPAESEGAAATGAGAQTGPPISKRQAKRLKAAMRKEGGRGAGDGGPVS
ncbi:RNase P subunit p30-domain-containing protein [Durotheca rogersii]|uniref:RNase P subunit p30-domain-containing protein n=1 Tax=Durotheca rogersii TaxID=419775 RepID=UPI0022203FFD|nr:RNase P subunit p30-domain-containing protein [Durotheca rogersii]KAI5865870.1 RNase P subunit p30-domain-containing protein [Durotheca rogersii]